MADPDMRGSMLLKRKGVVFTIISLILSAFFVMLFMPSYRADMSVERDLASSRVAQFDEFIENFPVYAETAAEIASYDAIVEMNRFVQDEGLVIECGELQNYFEGCLVDGGFDYDFLGISYDCTTRTLQSRISEVANLSEDMLNADVSFSVSDISIGQPNAWVINVRATLSFQVNDSSTRWSGSRIIVADVPVEGLPDPLYSYHNGDTRPIIETDTADNEWDIDTLKDFIQRGEFRYYNKAPSYLARLCNARNYSGAGNRCCGIESFIPLEEFIDLGDNVPLRNLSFVDYLFYNNEHFIYGTSLFTVSGFTELELEDITIDADHLIDFEINSKLWRPVTEE